MMNYWGSLSYWNACWKMIQHEKVDGIFSSCVSRMSCYYFIFYYRNGWFQEVLLAANIPILLPIYQDMKFWILLPIFFDTQIALFRARVGGFDPPWCVLCAEAFFSSEKCLDSSFFSRLCLRKKLIFLEWKHYWGNPTTHHHVPFLEAPWGLS